MKKILFAFVILMAGFSTASAGTSNVICRVGGAYFEAHDVKRVQYYDNSTQITLDSGSYFYVNGLDNFCIYTITRTDKADLMIQFRKTFNPGKKIISDER